MFFTIKIIIAVVWLFILSYKYNFLGWASVGLAYTVTQNRGHPVFKVVISTEIESLVESLFMEEDSSDVDWFMIAS